MKSSKEEIVLSSYSRELSEQRFVKVFDQNQKQVEVRNQRTGTPADLLYCGRTVILKNICKRLLFNFFNGSLLHGPKGLRSRFYNGVRLQGLSHRSSFCFKAGISRPEASRNLHSKT